jgi:hypothetical protein
MADMWWCWLASQTGQGAAAAGVAAGAAGGKSAGGMAAVGMAAAAGAAGARAAVATEVRAAHDGGMSGGCQATCMMAGTHLLRLG